MFTVKSRKTGKIERCISYGKTMKIVPLLVVPMDHLYKERRGLLEQFENLRIRNHCFDH